MRIFRNTDPRTASVSGFTDRVRGIDHCHGRDDLHCQQKIILGLRKDHLMFNFRYIEVLSHEIKHPDILFCGLPVKVQQL